MQKAVKFVPKSKETWLNYFSLELQYMEKLRQRLETLPNLKREEEKEDKEEGERGEKESDTVDAAALPEAKEEEDNQMKNPLDTPYLKGAVLEVIFENAVHFVPDDVDFRIEFIKICDKHQITEELRDKMTEKLIKEFPHSHKVWDMVAQLKWNEIVKNKKDKERTKSTLQEIFSNYERGLEEVFSSNSFSLYFF